MKRLKVSVYLTTTNRKQIQVLHRFAKGVDICDDFSHPIMEDRIIDSDVAVILWSPKIVPNAPETNFRCEVFEYYRQRNKPVVIIEQPIIRHQKYKKFAGFYQYRVGLNDVTRLGNFANKNKPGDRWNNLVLSLQDWRKAGTDYVVCGQYPFDYSLGGIDLNLWAENAISVLQKNTTCPVKFKPHPLQIKMNLPLPNVDVEILNEINWDVTRATVTYSSGMSIDSLMHGVPCITTSERNFAWDYSSHDLKNPHQLNYCNRQQLFHDLSYAQWSINEFEQGLCWKNLRTEVLNLVK